MSDDKVMTICASIVICFVFYLFVSCEKEDRKLRSQEEIVKMKLTTNWVITVEPRTE